MLQNIPADKTSEKGHLLVSENAISRLFYKKSPSNIEGLTVEDLTTAFIIIIGGELGVSLIHDSGYLAPEFILDEFGQLGPFKYWTVGYNPKFYPKGNEEPALKTFLERFLVTLGTMLDKNKLIPTYIRAKDGFLSISRKGEINARLKPKDIITPLDLEARKLITKTNRYFLVEEQDERLVPDMQFNGLRFFNIPFLGRGPEDVLELSKLPRYKRDPALSENLALHSRVCQILKEHTEAAPKDLSPAFENPSVLYLPSGGPIAEEPAIVKKVKKGVLESVQQFTDEAGNVNESYSAGNTLLHFAALRGHTAIVELLVKAGAQVDIFNQIGRTPLHEAAENGHLETVSKLLELRADFKVKDGVTHLTAANLAYVAGHGTITQFMCKFMTYQESFLHDMNYILYKWKNLVLNKSTEYMYLDELSSQIRDLEDADEVFKRVGAALKGQSAEIKSRLKIMNKVIVTNMHNYNLNRTAENFLAQQELEQQAKQVNAATTLEVNGTVMAVDNKSDTTLSKNLIKI